MASLRTALPFLAAAVIVAACSQGSSGTGGPPPAPPPSATPASGKFDHVIVIVQENRTLDNLFNGFPGADTVRRAMSGNTEVPLKEVPLEPNPGADHSYGGFVTDYNGGAMNGFGTDSHGNPQSAYEYVNASDVRNYWMLAKRFTLADHVFQMNMGPSFAAHVNLIAAQGGYPMAFAGNARGHGGEPGCFGNAQVSYVDMRLPYPSPLTKGPACAEMSTIFDLLDERGISWRYYAPANGIGRSYWSAPDYIEHLARGADHANLVNPETHILGDIANGALAPVSYVVPSACTSDHPHNSTREPLGGPKWVATITNAIGASTYWNNTLILVTWDDWGGFYDHVPPTVLGADQLGFRVPLLVISAYTANPGSVDHRVRTQASILSAIETAFGLPSLNQLDARSDDLSADLRLNRTPQPYGAPLPAATAPPGSHCPVKGFDTGDADFD